VSNADPIGEQLLAAINRGAAPLIVDMTANLSCDHAGADALARVHWQAVASGTDLRLVITAPVIRLAMALSRLDRPVSIYPTVAAAQSPGSVLPFPFSPEGAGSDGAALPPDDRRPVSWRQEADPTNLPGGYHADQAAPQWLEDTLTQITGSLFDAGLTLQTALDLPSGALRQAAERALDLLDGTISQARSAAFAGQAPGIGAPDGVREPSAALRPGMPAGTKWPDAAGSTSARLSKLRQESQRTRSRSRELKARTLEAAARSAATEDRVAGTLVKLAADHPRHLPNLRALREAAANEAAPCGNGRPSTPRPGSRAALT